MTNHWQKGLLIILGVLMFLTIGGCASWKQNRDNLEERAMEYHRLIRWQETGGASAYIADALRPIYLEKKSSLDTIKVIDFKLKHLELSPNREQATVIVEYQYHHKNATRIKTMTETQQWEFYPDADPSGWRITSLPPEFP